jgi:MFS family permease
MGFVVFQQLLGEHAAAVTGSASPLLAQAPLLVFAIICVPAAYVGDALGRPRAIALGALATAALLLLTYLGRDPLAFALLAAAAGAGWALINSNAIPYVLDEAPFRHRGLAIGLYYSTFALSALAAPRLLAGAPAVLAGDRQFLLAPLLFLAAGVAILPLLRQAPASEPIAYEQSPAS